MQEQLGRPPLPVVESVRAPLRGLSVRQAAGKLGVSAATAHRWLQRGHEGL